MKHSDCAVVLTVDRNMFLPGIVVADEVANMRGADRYDVILLAENGSIPVNFHDWHERRGRRFSVVETKFATNVPAHAVLTSRFPTSSMFRLQLPEFFRDRYRRILYLDADTEVVRPLSQLFNLDLGDSPVAAADDLAPSKKPSSQCLRSSRTSELRDRAGLKPGGNRRYANSGVILFDVEQWRRQSISERALKFLIEHPTLCKFPDQDALNAVLPTTYCLLSPYWNFRADIDAFSSLRRKVEPAIVHYSGDCKPWIAELWQGDRDASERYKRHFSGSPWPSGPPAPGWLGSLDEEKEKLHAGDSCLRRMARRCERAFRKRRREVLTALTPDAHAVSGRTRRKQRLFESYLRDTPFADIDQNLLPAFNKFLSAEPHSSSLGSAGYPVTQSAA